MPELKCCRCLEIRVGIFLLGLWSIIVTVGYYIGFVMEWDKSPSSSLPDYPTPILYVMAALGFIGGSFGIFASIFKSIPFSKVFFVWTVIHFFSQFAEGIIYAAAGYSLYILFFIDFVIWGYFIIVVNQYIQYLKSQNLYPRRLMVNNRNYQSTSP